MIHHRHILTGGVSHRYDNKSNPSPEGDTSLPAASAAGATK